MFFVQAVTIERLVIPDTNDNFGFLDAMIAELSIPALNNKCIKLLLNEYYHTMKNYRNIFIFFVLLTHTFIQQ